MAETRKSTTAKRTAPRKTASASPGGSRGSATAEGIQRDMDGIVTRASEEFDRLGEVARERGASFANAQKSRSASAIASIAENLRNYGDDLDDSPQIQDVVDGTAEKLDEIAGQLRSKSFGDLYQDVEDFAREQPLTVAAGALLLGFAAARLLGAAGDDRRRS